MGAAAMSNKGTLEPTITEHLGQAPAFGSRFLHCGNAACVVGHAGGHDHHRDKQPEGVNDPEGLSS
jgi:hypothetical protein